MSHISFFVCFFQFASVSTIFVHWRFIFMVQHSLVFLLLTLLVSKRDLELPPAHCLQHPTTNISPLSREAQLRSRMATAAYSHQDPEVPSMEASQVDQEVKLDNLLNLVEMMIQVLPGSRVIPILTSFTNHLWACSQVVPLVTLIPKLFLFYNFNHVQWCG